MSERPCYMYTVRHLESGTLYYGIAYNTDRRWKRHLAEARAGGQVYFHRALRKHGQAAFAWTRTLLPSAEHAKVAEIQAIATALSAHIPLYNMTCGGDGALKLAPEALERKLAGIRKAHADPEVRRRMSEGIRAAHTPAVRAQKSASAKQVGARPEIKAIRSATQKIRWQSKEAKLEQASKSRQRWLDPEYAKRVSEGHKACWADATKKLHRIRNCVRASTNPEYRARLSAAVKAAKSTPEAKARISAAGKAAWARRKAAAALVGK